VSYEHLLSPGRIGALETRNRIVMSPMGSNLAEPDGSMGERISAYYEARARGGAGLLIVGVGAIAHPIGTCNPNQVGISDDVFLPGLEGFTARVHAHGARVAIQLQHAGKVATQDIAAGRPMWVPSTPALEPLDLYDDLTREERREATASFRRPGANASFHEMTHDDIAWLVERFAEAGLRARRTGFDGVEVHAAHGYIVAEFLSAATNRRTDEYGGAIEDRARLLCEIISAIKNRAGRDFPVWCRLDGREFRIEGGITPDDARRTAELAVAAGADAAHVSAYADSSVGAAFTEAPLVDTPGGFVELAAAVKAAVAVPVIAVGRIEPDLAESIIADGKADFVAMGRKLLADPDLPAKLASGRSFEIRPCIYGYTCVGRVFLNRQNRCAVNPLTGREHETPIGSTERRRRVIVVGGGPGGMEVARIAAVRGHEVTLVEARENLGGTLAASAALHEPNGELVRYLVGAVDRAGVDVHLGQQVTRAWIQEAGADVVVVATGAEYAASPAALPATPRYRRPCRGTADRWSSAPSRRPSCSVARTFRGHAHWCSAAGWKGWPSPTGSHGPVARSPSRSRAARSESAWRRPGAGASWPLFENAVSR
jgi:2,4-dienoyl-CoA reductase (NADPH2)